MHALNDLYLIHKSISYAVSDSLNQTTYKVTALLEMSIIQTTRLFSDLYIMYINIIKHLHIDI